MEEHDFINFPIQLCITRGFADKMITQNVPWEDVLMAHMKLLTLARNRRAEDHFALLDDQELVVSIMEEDGSLTEVYRKPYDLLSLISLGNSFHDWPNREREIEYIDAETQLAFPYGERFGLDLVADIDRVVTIPTLHFIYQTMLNRGFDLHAEPKVKEMFTLWESLSRPETHDLSDAQIEHVKLYALALTDVGISFKDVMGHAPPLWIQEAIEESRPRLSAHVECTPPFDRHIQKPFLEKPMPLCDAYIYDMKSRLSRYMYEAVQQADRDSIHEVDAFWQKISPLVRERNSHITQMIEDKKLAEPVEEPQWVIEPKDALVTKGRANHGRG